MFNERGTKEDKTIKSAFERVKQDILSLGNELSSLKLEIIDLKNQLNTLNESVNSIKSSLITAKTTQIYPKIHPTQTPTHQQINPTVGINPTDNPTVPCEVRGLKYPNFDISMGNRGVPTNQQTNQQTDIPTHFYDKNTQLNTKISLNKHIEDAAEILSSLDIIKKEIRIKFKQITSQEMLVFSTLYTLEEQYPEGISYEQISQKLRLSSSSIRDYIQRLISKGIPILKDKVNNKKILLKISPELKKIASLETILKLREL